MIVQTLANLAMNLTVQGMAAVDTALTSVKAKLANVAAGTARPMTALATMQSALAGLASSALAAITPIGLIVGAVTAAGIAVIALTKALWDCSRAAAELQDKAVRLEQVFGTATPEILRAADAMASTAGVDRKEFLSLVQTYGQIAQAAGIAADKSDEFGVSFAKLATDASRSLNIPLKEAAKMIESGLNGDSLPELGVNLSENFVKAEAMRLGLVGVNRELTENQRVTARASIMTRELAHLNGTAENEVGGFNEQLTILSNSMTRIGEGIGRFVTPAFTLLLRLVNWVVGSVADLVNVMADLWDEAGKFLGLQESDDDRDKRLGEVDARRKRFTDDKNLEQKLISDRSGKQTGARGQSLESFAKSLFTAGFGQKKDISQQLLAVQQQQLNVLQRIDAKAARPEQPKIAVAK